MKRLLLYPLSALLVFTFGITAYASIPASNGTINGCYKISSGPGPVPAGQLVVIDSAATCPSGYAPLNWNQTGVQGPVGQTGATGSTGATGPQGPAGLLNSQAWTALDSD